MGVLSSANLHIIDVGMSGTQFSPSGFLCLRRTARPLAIGSGTFPTTSMAISLHQLHSRMVLTSTTKTVVARTVALNVPALCICGNVYHTQGVTQLLNHPPKAWSRSYGHTMLPATPFAMAVCVSLPEAATLKGGLQGAPISPCATAPRPLNGGRWLLLTMPRIRGGSERLTQPPALARHPLGVVRG